MSNRITRGALIAGAGAAAIGIGIAATRPEHEPELGDPLVARRVDAVPVDDPRSDAWVGEGETVLPLLPQQLANPKLAEATVPDVRVAALHDGTTLGLRLSWEQGRAGELSGVAVFGDAVAVMIPGAGPQVPPITMGAAGKPVHILQWHGSWQRDVELGTSQGVAAQFPNVIRDLDPGEILPPEAAVRYTPGRAVGNPMSAASRTTPVEELVAEGFSSTTSLAEQRAVGRGVHHERRWWVAIGIPLQRGRGFAPLAPGQRWPLAVAVWSGDAGNRGGRKHYAEWASLQLEA